MRKSIGKNHLGKCILISILSVFCICKIRVFVKISEFSSHYDGGDGGVVKGRPGLRGNKYLLPFMGDGGGCGV